MANSVDATIADLRRKVAISLAKKIQSKAESLANYLETNALEHHQQQNEVNALKIELAKRNAQLKDAVNKGTQIRRIAKKYKDSYYQLQSNVDTAGHPPAQKLNDASVQEENVECMPTENDFVRAVDLRDSYAKNLLQENRARIAALTTSNQLTNVQQCEVVDVVKRWKDLDAKMQQIIDENTKRAGDVVNGRKRRRHMDDSSWRCKMFFSH